MYRYALVSARLRHPASAGAIRWSGSSSSTGVPSPIGREPPSSMSEYDNLEPGSLYPDFKARSNPKNANSDAEAAKKKALTFASAKKDLVSNAKQALFRQYNVNEHFLLVDLDADKDALLYGSSREEFYDNVKRMKEVVIEYNRWERADKLYTWGTRFLQLLSAWLVFDCMMQQRYKSLLLNSMDNFHAAQDQIMHDIDERRAAAISAALDVLKKSPPVFTKPEAAATTPKASEPLANPMDALQREKRKQDKTAAEEREIAGTAAVDNAGAWRNTEFLRAMRRILLPQSDDWTTLVKQEIVEYHQQKLKEMTFPGGEVARRL